MKNLTQRRGDAEEERKSISRRRGAHGGHKEIANNKLTQRRRTFGSRGAGAKDLISFCSSFAPLRLCVSFFLSIFFRAFVSSVRGFFQRSPRLCVRSFLSILITAIFVSCATAPKVSLSGEDEVGVSLLPAGGKVYLWADTVKARPLLDVLSFEGRSGKDAAKVLDSTKNAAAVIFPGTDTTAPGGGEGPGFFLAALGDYPRVSASFSLAFSSAWKKLKSSTGNSYWFSKDDNIALALGSKLALVSDSDPFAELEREKVSPPQDFADFRQGLVFAGWIPDPSGSIDSFLKSMGVPLQMPAEEFFFGAARVPAASAPAEQSTTGDNSAASQWELVFTIKTPSAAQSRSLLSLFSIARLFIVRGAGAQTQTAPQGNALIMNPQEAAALLFANLPEQNGEKLTLRTSPLGENRIALLFSLFSIYSN